MVRGDDERWGGSRLKQLPTQRRCTTHAKPASDFHCFRGKTRGDHRTEFAWGLSILQGNSTRERMVLYRFWWLINSCGHIYREDAPTNVRSNNSCRGDKGIARFLSFQPRCRCKGLSTSCHLLYLGYCKIYFDTDHEYHLSLQL